MAALDELKRLYRNARELFFGDLLFLKRRLDYDELTLHGLSALALQEKYAALATPHKFHSEINRHEARVYSQNGEDGILLFLFSKISAPHHTFVEFGINDGRECNSANLALNFGWHGLLIEGSQKLSARAHEFYKAQLVGPASNAVTIANAFVRPDNINDLLRAHRMTGEIDLLSIDIDSHDYWVWEQIAAVQPRVVVAEINGSFGATEAVTIPYDESFNRFAAEPHGFYYGMSVAAAEKLGKQKGYALVGCDTSGVNAFLVRNDLLAATGLPVLTSEQAFYPMARRTRARTVQEQWDMVKRLPLTRV